MLRYYSLCVFIGIFLAACSTDTPEKNMDEKMSELKVSENNRYLVDGQGEPFFWLGDTAWLLFTKLNREDAITYLDNRKQKGFNIIQVMAIPSVESANVYGDSAFTSKSVAQPRTTEGSQFDDSTAYDYWDHVDYVIKEAAKRNLYMALVPVWGNNVKSGNVSREEAGTYATFLADRYKGEPNIVWLNGGDTFGSDSTATWNIIGNTLNEEDTQHLITFHPRGRKMSSMWFHEKSWLDFNMIQSGHRRYDQDDTELNFGEDNWRYVTMDYRKKPVKPTIDAEPSYEEIPQGLHDAEEPRWKARHVRRYGYWSVFAGAFGYTYGHNAVMQMHEPGDEGAFGVKKAWYNAIDDPGAQQMIHLKELMLSRPFLERVPDSSLVVGQGKRNDYVSATRGNDYAFIYTYNGRKMNIAMGKIHGKQVRATWYSPRDGSKKEIGTYANEGTREFDPPGEKQNGNDWVLILDSL